MINLLATNYFKAIIFTLLSSLYHVGSVVSVCKRKTSQQGTTLLTCPEAGQPADKIHCCGNADDINGEYCCHSVYSAEDIKAQASIEVFQSIGTVFISFVSIVVGIILFLFIVATVCCCFCPCCLCYKGCKNRHRGRVYRTANINDQQSMGVSATGPGAQQRPPEIVSQVSVQGPGYPLQPPASCPIEPTGCPLQQPHYYSPRLGYPPQQQNYTSGQPLHDDKDPPPPYSCSGTEDPYARQAPYNPSFP